MCHMAVDVRCLLLAKLRRGDIPRFAEFVATRDLAAGTIAAVASAAADSAASASRRGSSAGGEASGTAWVEVQRKAAERAIGTELHRLLARMRAAERRLMEADEVFWNSGEHAGAHRRRSHLRLRGAEGQPRVETKKCAGR